MLQREDQMMIDKDVALGELLAVDVRDVMRSRSIESETFRGRDWRKFRSSG